MPAHITSNLMYPDNGRSPNSPPSRPNPGSKSRARWHLPNGSACSTRAGSRVRLQNSCPAATVPMPMHTTGTPAASSRGSSSTSHCACSHESKSAKLVIRHTTARPVVGTRLWASTSCPSSALNTLMLPSLAAKPASLPSPGLTAGAGSAGAGAGSASAKAIMAQSGGATWTLCSGAHDRRARAHARWCCFRIASPTAAVNDRQSSAMTDRAAVSTPGRP
mmetsp:Transcript_64272/g.106309  ORF Transcript_64272/g.106309 Transcript_64272/m.106309 type:complete len:220 (-) Transcript_64272:374-1033(-)